MRFWKIYLFLNAFYLGNRNCAEILRPIFLVEMESPPGKVLNHFHGLETGQLPRNPKPNLKVRKKSIGLWGMAMDH